MFVCVSIFEKDFVVYLIAICWGCLSTLWTGC
jgi:hypothetical protein